MGDLLDLGWVRGRQGGSRLPPRSGFVGSIGGMGGPGPTTLSSEGNGAAVALPSRSNNDSSTCPMGPTATPSKTRTESASDPEWDLTPFFPTPLGPEYRDFRAALESDVEALVERVEALAAISADPDGWAGTIADLEGVWARTQHIGSYLSCSLAVESTNADLRRESAWAAAQRAALEPCFARVRMRLGELDDAAFEEFVAREDVAPAAFLLGRLREDQAFRMEPELEALATELDLDGASAWGRLYGKLAGALTFELERPDGTRETHPIASARTLQEDADPRIRRAAFVGASAAWEGASDVVAACLNAIVGQRLTLQRRRGVKHVLDPALHAASIERRTLDAMLAAVDERAEVPRSFLRLKARLLGQERLNVWDIAAPLPGSEGDPAAARIPYEQGVERVLGAFAAEYPRLGEFARRAVASRWIDHTPRPGKRPGGFCSTSQVLGEPRVFLNYSGSTGDVATLAHELGHGWHGWLLRDERPFSRRYPMTLAETASTFAEHLMSDALLAEEGLSSAARASLLNARLQQATSYLLNIRMRVRFELALHERRATGELGAAELSELVLDAQRETYGDALAEDGLDPWFWASKMHFYLTSISFYNFPYTFGYLLSLGLRLRARGEGEGFHARYEKFLRRTGRATAEDTLRDVFGIELGESEFWRTSIDAVAEDLARLEIETGMAGANPA